MEKTEQLEQLIATEYGNTGAVIVQKDGSTVYEYYMSAEQAARVHKKEAKRITNVSFTDCTASSPFHVFSVTKSIMSLLIGIAIDKGFIQSIQQPVLDFFPDYTIKKREKTIQNITLKDMLTMTAPYKYKYAPYIKYFSSDDWVKSSLDLLGGRGKIGEFRYAPVIGPDIFSGIIVNVTGKKVLDFAKEYLFEPLEINVPGNIEFHDKEGQMEFYKSRTARGWVIGPTGVHTGGWGLVLEPSDMLKIGQLLLNNGKWNGQQLISEEWIRESTSQKVQWKNLKYGYLWWIIDEKEQSYAALGDGGNVIYINPKREMTVVIASYFKPRVEDRMNLIKEYIEPLWS